MLEISSQDLIEAIVDTHFLERSIRIMAESTLYKPAI